MADIINQVSDKGISIGIIGPEGLVKKILKVLTSFPSFRPVPQNYTDENEAPHLAQQMAGDIEVLLVSGALAYKKIREQTNLHIPVHQVPLTDTSFYRALLRLRNLYGSYQKISVDTLSKQMVENALREIGDKETSVTYFGGSSYASNEQLVEFHREQYEKGNVSISYSTIMPRERTKVRLKAAPSQWRALTAITANIKSSSDAPAVSRDLTLEAPTFGWK
jgi:hypothetical protein